MMPGKSTSQVTIPTLLGILFLVLGIVVGVLTIQSRQVFRSRANHGFGPQDVTITNVTDSSFTVSWTTEGESVGSVAWGKSANRIENQTEEAPLSLIHHISVEGLEPRSTYYFQIFSDQKPYLDNLNPWVVTTAQKLPPPTRSVIASGVVFNPDKTPATNTVVYLEIDSGPPRSTLTSESGRWIIPISEIRNDSLSSYINIDNQTSIISVTATNSKLKAEVSFRPRSSNPAPDIILGQNHGFVDLEPKDEVFRNPEVSFSVQDYESPKEILPEEKHELDQSAEIPAELVVEISSVEDGENLKDTLPEFYGTGTPNLEITITIESDPITETLTIDQNGVWEWLPPTKLEDGLHTITVTFIDSNGILQSIRKQFVVSASGDESDKIVTNTPTPSPTKIPLATPTPTETPKVEAQLPDTGTTEGTLALAGSFLAATVGALLIFLF